MSHQRRNSTKLSLTDIKFEILSKMYNNDIKDEKISSVNLVNTLMKTLPSTLATSNAITNNQIPMYTLIVR